MRNMGWRMAADVVASAFDTARDKMKTQAGRSLATQTLPRCVLSLTSNGVLPMYPELWDINNSCGVYHRWWLVVLFNGGKGGIENHFQPDKPQM
ncbi:hypothetical protein PHLCEN_2v11454 [Hermanssonia centrifuga]|uniref:Uncharacterized protein n=1 Tax=Hermanssonia centrifuga TaxID=98765 RepID=A0A2R6NJZ2_9APHY|nr:hypothetical protein PHLCEN_2v11454 [Hermanssonia centrifuga]